MSSRTIAPESPYKGLRPFEATAVDALLFFGRERERELIAANLSAARLTVLYGESGVGKSSVLRAGVVQWLRQQAREGAGFAVALYARWSDEDPIEGIAEAAREAVGDVLGRDPGDATGSLPERLEAWSDFVAGEIYLVLDQVDEYFLYHGSGGGPLLDELPLLVTEPGLRVNVLLGIREDSVARLDVFKARIPNLFGNYLRLERLGREAGRAAIIGPLEQWSRMTDGEAVTIEPALVDTILDEVAVGRIDGNGSGPQFESRTVEPPYLQIVLERIWDAERQAGSSVLRLETLERLGGARRIVSEHLDRALQALAPAELDTAAAMFTHLVTPSGAKIAHGVGDLAVYAGVDEAAAQDVASALVEERILRPVEGEQGDGARVEIFHDVLAGAVAAWGREHEAARALETERAEARRKHRRLLGVVVAALIALVAMTVVAVYAVAQQQEADDQRARAAAQAAVATSRERAAQALLVLPTNPVGALRLAARAAEVEPSARTEDVLRTTLVQSRQRAVFGTGAEVRVGAFSPDGETIAIGDVDGRVVVAPRLGKASFHARHRGAVNALAFAGDRTLVTGSDDRTAVVWDLRRRGHFRRLRHGDRVLSVAVSQDGRLLATGASKGHARVWALADGSPVQDIAFPSPVEHVSLSPDARRVLAVGGGNARLFDIASGRLVASFERESGVTDAAISYDGRLVATGYKGERAAVRVWEADSGRLKGVLLGHTGAIRDVEFSPVGPWLVSASADGTARVWNVAVNRGRQFIGTLIGHENLVVSARFSPDGTKIVTASADRTAGVWKLESNNLVKLVGHRDTVLGAEMSADGLYVLSWGADGTARVWDWNPDPVATRVGRVGAPAAQVVLGAAGKVVASLDAEGDAHVRRLGDKRIVTLTHPGGAEVLALSADGRRVALCGKSRCTIWTSTGHRGRTVAHGGPVLAAAFSGDGRWLVTAGSKGRARIWKVAGRTPARTIRAQPRTLTAAALNRDGSTLALGDGAGTIVLWNVAAGRVEHALEGHRNDITALAFSPNGRLLVSGSRDHDARIWRVADGARRHLLRRHFVLVRDVDFSPDGRWVITVGETRIGLWSALTGTRVTLVQGSKDPFLAATFAPNSRVIRTAGLDGMIRKYSCQVCGHIAALRALAEQRLSRAAP